MLYRKFGKTDFDVSILGFGCMRLPVVNGDNGNINEPEAIRIIRYAIDNGVNYIDTAYPYHKENGEIIVGKALQDGYREKVHLATKLPIWLTQDYSDFERILNEQLNKLQTDSIDFYLLHALDKETWPKAKDMGVFEFLSKALKDKKIKHVGFSFHDELPLFKEIVDAYPWTFCQIQLNYMDEHYQAGIEGLRYAAEKDMAVIVMEPLKGGRLAKTPPPAVQSILESSKTKHSPAEWALRWVWNHPEVSVLLSGMNSINDVIQNLETADAGYPNSLEKHELETINKVKKTYEGFNKVDCTGCLYCMPCPSGVDIPRNFQLYNDASMFDAQEASRVYNSFLEEGKRASACVECGKCETVCPQNLSIRRHLKETSQLLAL